MDTAKALPERPATMIAANTTPIGLLAMTVGVAPAVLRQVLSSDKSVDQSETRGDLREFCVIESCIVMHSGAN